MHLVNACEPYWHTSQQHLIGYGHLKMLSIMFGRSMIHQIDDETLIQIPADELRKCFNNTVTFLLKPIASSMVALYKSKHNTVLVQNQKQHCTKVWWVTRDITLEIKKALFQTDVTLCCLVSLGVRSKQTNRWFIGPS